MFIYSVAVRPAVVKRTCRIIATSCRSVLSRDRFRLSDKDVCRCLPATLMINNYCLLQCPCLFIDNIIRNVSTEFNRCDFTSYHAFTWILKTLIWEARLTSSLITATRVVKVLLMNSIFYWYIRVHLLTI